MNAPSITEAFNRYFYVTPADTSQLRERVHRIRYDVYCREFGFEREEDCPDGLERDDYDDQSRHCLAVHRPTGQAAGCVRLVLTDPADPDAPLPFERYCSHALRRDLFDSSTVERRLIGECSRLAIPAQFRRRATDQHKPVSLPAEHPVAIAGRDNFPYLPVSLFMAMTAMGLNAGCEYVVAMMEPPLARLIRRFGLPCAQIGEVVDYHGPRAPFVWRRDSAFSQMPSELYKLLHMIDRQLSANAHDS
ncbi:N-acyl amino acid synthase of PEP-CTERM/exosortase system [Plasticicumulans lactativorans]|uniref:N-acyl amino acid synthase of PEP-CTERM/exosortase system n=1 Tax=Plasticicumulans lactativorans TaxID=1133106 RepID=A0A4R2L5D0_9GAMM|nr:PEP-CTERM/exosortase system-associated acyltransferase [Plasticicumulans lactativorans]TCO81002.1 N-acyl amino acid synthase of PEP-CTERM/exosortase system [Plasticicumulans lactativorans]